MDLAFSKDLGKGRKTGAAEQELFEVLPKDDGYRVVSKAKRVAHLRKVQRRRDDD